MMLCIINIIENHILSYLFKPLLKRKRCCAMTKNKRVCKCNSNSNSIFCRQHDKKFQESIRSSNKFESVCVKSIFLHRKQKN